MKRFFWFLKLFSRKINHYIEIIKIVDRQNSLAFPDSTPGPFNVEQEKANRRQKPASSYAQSFAAKEAFAKALGTGFKRGVFWRDISVQNHPSGQPFLKITGGAMARLKELTPPSMEFSVYLTQTDEYPMANAVVIIEALPIPPESRHP